MKNILSRAVVCSFIVIFSSSLLFAQRAAPKYPEFHYLTLSFGGGYSNMFTKLDNASIQGGGGATLGLGYEYCFRSFWLALGVEGQFISSQMSPGLDTLNVPMLDTEGEEFTMTYRFDKWHDMTQAAYVNIPFMVGMNFGGFYAGIGAKAGINVYASGASKLEYNTSGKYEQLIGDFVNMDNHWFGDFVSEKEGGKPTKLVFKPNVSVIAELGYEIFSAEGGKGVWPMRMKLGAYGEYGLMNINGSASDAKAYSFGDPNPAILLTPAVMSTDKLQGKAVNPFYVGVKLTLMFEIPVPQKCNCLQDARGASWRNNAPKVTKAQDRRTKKGQAKESK